MFASRTIRSHHLLSLRAGVVLGLAALIGLLLAVPAFAQPLHQSPILPGTGGVATSPTHSSRLNQFPHRTLDTNPDPWNVWVNRSYDWVAGFAAPGTDLVITLTRNSQVIGTAEVQAGGDTWFFTNLFDSQSQQVDFRVGDIVWVTGGGKSATVPVVAMESEVRSDTGTVSGSIGGPPVPAHLRIVVWRDNGATRDITTDGAGKFSTSLGAGAVRAGDNVSIWYVRPDGHLTGIVRSEFRLDVDVTDDEVWGQTTPIKKLEFTLESLTSLQSVKGLAYAMSNEEGQFGASFHENDGPTIDIAPGDKVSGSYSNAGADLVVPSPFSADYDHVVDTVCGQGPPGLGLNLELWGFGQTQFTVGEDGNYCVDLSQFGDPQIEDEGRVSYTNEDGHGIGARFRTPAPDLWVEKWADSQPPVGRPFRWQLRTGNKGNAAASDVILIDTLPDGVSFVSESTQSASRVGNQLIWNLGTVAAGAERSITVTVQATAEKGTDVKNCVQVAGSTWERFIDNNNACDTRQVFPDEVDLWVDSNPSPGNPVPGQEYVYYVHYGNNRPAAAENVKITDTLPISVTFVSEWHPAGWDVDLSYPGEVIWTRGELADWQGGSLELRLRVNDDVPVKTRLRNHVAIGSPSFDADPGNNVKENDAWTDNPQVDLAINQDYGGGSPVAGQRYAIWTEIRNNGNFPAPSTILTQTLPANTTLGNVVRFEWDPATGGDKEVAFPPSAQGPGWARWELGTVVNWRPVRLRADLLIGGSVPAGTLLTNRVAASSQQTDVRPADNQSEYQFKTQPPGANLRARKWLQWGNPLPGETLEYWIEAINDGTEPAENVFLADILPAGVTLQGHGGKSDPSVAGPKLEWSLGRIDADTSYGFWVQVRINLNTPVGAVLANTVELRSSSGEVRADDNNAQVVDRVGPDLRIEKELIEGPALPGRQMRYRVRVWNNGRAWAHNTLITDTLPTGCTFAGSDLGGEVENGKVVWRAQTLPGEWAHISPFWYGEFELRVDVGRNVLAGAVLTNRIEIDSELGDASPADNVATATTTVASPYAIRVQESHNWVGGRVLPDAHVKVTLRSAGGVVKTQRERDADGEGSFQIFDFDQDIVVGDRVDVDTEGTATIMIPIVRIDGTVNPVANTITGRIYSVPFPAAIRGEVWTPNGPPEAVGQTAANGTFTLSFAPFDLKNGHEVALWYVRPDGHQVGIVRAALAVRVYPTDDFVTGVTSPNTVVLLTLRDSGGTFKGQTQVTSDGEGRWGADFFSGTTQLEIEDQDTVRAIAGSIVADVTVPHLDVMVDAVHGLLGINSELTNVQVEVRWDSQPGMDNHDFAHRLEATTGADGNLRMEFPASEVPGLGVEGNLVYTTPDGQSIEPWWRAMIGEVDPAEFANDHAQTVYVVGKRFQATPQAFLLHQGAPPVPLSGVTFLGPELVRVTIPAGTPAAFYGLRLDNPDERIGFLSGALIIRNPTPVVSTIDRGIAFWDESFQVTLVGSGFVEGAGVTMVRGTSVITPTEVTLAGPGVLRSSFDLRRARTGMYDVVVMNPGPGHPSHTLQAAIRVDARVRLPMILKR